MPSSVAEFEAVTRALKSPAPAVEPPPGFAARSLASVQHTVKTAGEGDPAATARSTVRPAGPVPQPSPAVAPGRPFSRSGTRDRAAAGASKKVEALALARLLLSRVRARGGGSRGGRGGVGQSYPSGPDADFSSRHQRSVHVGPGPAVRHATAHKTACGWQIDLAVMNLPPPGKRRVLRVLVNKRVDGLSLKPLVTQAHLHGSQRDLHHARVRGLASSRSWSRDTAPR